MRSKTPTTIATYCLLSLAGAVSIVLPDSVTPPTPDRLTPARIPAPARPPAPLEDPEAPTPRAAQGPTSRPALPTPPLSRTSR